MDTTFLAKIDSELNREITNRQTYYQMKYFMLGKEPTRQSKMWFCLRELKTRRESIKAALLEIEELKDQTQLLYLKIERAKRWEPPDQGPYPLEEKENEIEIRCLERKITATQEGLNKMQEVLTANEQEAKFFYETFKAIEQVEPLKHWDDIDVQKEYWNQKLTEELSQNLILQSPMGRDTLNCILLSPDDLKIKQQMVLNIEKMKKKMDEKKKENIE